MSCKITSGVLLCAWLAFAHTAFAEPAAQEPAAEQTASEPAAAAVPPAASAETAADTARRTEAETCRERALSFYDSGDYWAARREFQRANELVPSFRLLYNLGVVSMALADWISAYDYFQGYLAEGGSEIAPDVRAQIQEQLADLQKQIVSLVIVVDTPGATVFVDKTRIGVAPLSGPLRLNPGPHQISARLSSGRSDNRALSFGSGEQARVELKVAVTPKVVAMPSSSPRRHVFWPGWAATAALTAASAVCGLEALSAQHRYQAAFDNIGASRAQLDELNARTTRWSVAADSLGGAAILTGAFSLYMSLRRPTPEHAGASAASSYSFLLLPNQARLNVSF